MDGAGIQPLIGFSIAEIQSPVNGANTQSDKSNDHLSAHRGAETHRSMNQLFFAHVKIWCKETEFAPPDKGGCEGDPLSFPPSQGGWKHSVSLGALHFLFT